MRLLPLLAKGAALCAALFSVAVHAGEWEEYKELKAAMVRSSSKVPYKVPAWALAMARDFEPRPHYWLDFKAGKRPAEPFILESTPDAPPPSPAPAAAPAVAPVQR